jgi:hypothetical protein
MIPEYSSKIHLNTTLYLRCSVHQPFCYAALTSDQFGPSDKSTEIMMTETRTR